MDKYEKLTKRCIRIAMYLVIILIAIEFIKAFAEIILTVIGGLAICLLFACIIEWAFDEDI